MRNAGAVILLFCSLLKTVYVQGLRKETYPEQDHDEGARAADQHGRHRTEPVSRDTGLAFAQLVRGADDTRWEGRGFMLGSSYRTAPWRLH